MANRRAEVDEHWLTAGPEVNIRGEQVRIVPVEEMIWGKIYILHRDRCDWPDVLNMVYETAPRLDWQHLLDRLGEDVLLLSGILSVLTWLCPGRTQVIPPWVLDRLSRPGPQQAGAPDIDEQRVNWIDTRPWFYPISNT
jgi:hypothetical protein